MKEKFFFRGLADAVAEKQQKFKVFFVFHEAMLSWNLNFCEKSNKKLKQQRRVDRPSSSAWSFFSYVT